MKKSGWILLKMATLLVISLSAYAVETAAPNPPNWGLDPVKGTLLRPGIAVHTVGTLSTPKVAADGDHALKLYDTRNPTLADTRPVQSVDVHTHHHWDTGSIGNVYGLAIDRDRNIYATASTHFGSYFGYTGANQAKITFGSIGAGATPDTAASDNNPGDLNDLNAAGTVYKIDAVTGDVSVFAQLPQLAKSFSHQACESGATVSRNTGPALGNITYDKIHNQFFVSNFEDGKIYRLDINGNQLSVFDPGVADDGSAGFAGKAADPAPYGLAVSPDGNKLYFGTHAVNVNPELFAVNLDSSGDFSGSEIDQHAKLVTDLRYTQNIGGSFVDGNVWVAYSDLQFSPNGELIVGLRTGCKGNFATSHNHGGSFYFLKQDAAGLYNTPADKVPGTGTTYSGIPDGMTDQANRAGDGRYDAGVIPIYTDKNSGVGDLGTGPDDGYGGIAVYDKGDGSYDYLFTTGDITVERGPHGFMLFPHDFTLDTSKSNLVGPAAAFASIPSSTTSSNDRDYKGMGGDVEVLSVELDWGDAPDTYSTDLITGNATGGNDVKGPTHILTSDGIILGTTVDGEFNGLASAGADGDDTLNSPDDEDGISSFPALLVGDTSYTIPAANIIAANASGGDVTIHAWIDFDGNGVFDADEYTSATVANGATSPGSDLVWSGAGVSGLTGGTTYARFRITNDPSIDASTPAGPASNGEVEDYALTITAVPGSWSGTVTEDVDNDGVIDDADDAGIQAVTITLYADDNGDGVHQATETTVAGTAQTDANGDYTISNVAPGNYVAVETQPAGFADVTEDEGGADDDAADNGVVNAIAGTVSSGENDANNDFVEIKPGSWSGTVTEDVDNDGVIDDADDAGIQSVTITLYADDNGDGVHQASETTVAGTAQTDVNGDYTISNVAPGNYIAVETQPAGFADVTEDEGGADDDAADNGVVNAIAGTVNSGEDDANNDFVEKALVSLGSLIWADSNSNGSQDAGEPGIPGASVKLLDGTGSPVAGVPIQTTLANGLYYFDNLSTGDYKVQVTLPAGYAPTVNQTVADNNDSPNDSNIAISIGNVYTSGKFTLSNDGEPDGVNSSIAGSDDADNGDDNNGNMTVDFGFISSLSIGSVIWEDSNSDGIQDTTEPVLQGAVVTLLVADGNGGFIPATDIHGVGVAPQTTLADGLYDFNELPDGDYKVEVKPPAGYVPSPVQQANADNNVANDSNIATETSVAGTYESGVVKLTAGTEPVEAGGFKGDAVDDAADSNGNMTIDFGFVQTASVNGRVWIDINGNNNVDDGVAAEQGVVGVMINLIDVGPDGQVGTADDSVVDSTTTGADGLYNFPDVVPSTYFVEFEEPAGMTFVSANQPGDDTIDSDADQVTGYTESFVLNPGQVVPDIDAGVEPGSVGDRVWLDVNQNGVQDAGEPGVPGITVDLLDSTGTTIIDTVVTDAGGLYAFNNLLPADYIIEFDLPVQMNVVAQDTGNDDTIDSDIDPVSHQIQVTVTSGPGNQTHDAGIEPAFIGNLVWFDSNENGQQDPGEPGVEGVTVELLAADGTTVVQTTTTDMNGEYGFAVIPGDYIVRVVTPAGAAFTSTDLGGDETKDSDVDTSTGKTALISVASGDDDQTWDAGIIPAKLSGTVLLDLNADGIQDNGEPGIDVVTITLAGTDVFGNQVLLTISTDTNGNYNFMVMPGTYTVTETDLVDYTSTGSEAGTVGSTITDDNTLAVTLASGDDSQGNDFLDTNVAMISGQVRLDGDADGDTSDSDTGITGVTIELLDDQGNVVDSTQTDPQGNYSFINVQPGDYTIQETDPAGHISTADVDGANDNTIAVTLPPGGSSTGNDYLDAVDTGVISGQVRLDSDADGDTSDPDTGIAGVTIELVDDQGNVIDTTQTDPAGNYSFTNVQPGDYTIRETDPASHTSTADTDGANDNSIAVTLPPAGSSTGNDYLDAIDTGVISGQVRLDSDADGDSSDPDTGIAGVTIELVDDQGNVIDTTQTDPAGNYSFTNVQPGDYTIRETDPASHTSTADTDGANDNSIAVTLPPGGSSTGNDFLDTDPSNNAGVTGVVWFDTNKDGVKDPGESGLSGWSIEVRDTNGSVIQTLTTQPDGTFSELNIGVGDFTVRFLNPGGIIVKEQQITLNPGDVAFVPEPIDPAGIVYNEDTGAPVPGAQVFLISNGVPLPPACLGVGEQGQATGADGAYNFFLNPGSDPACPVADTVYELQVIPPNGFQTTVNNPPQAGVLNADNCTIDAVAGITCEVSNQDAAPIIGIPVYFTQIELGIGDPGVFNNHIPLTPPANVAPPQPAAPVKPIPTLSEWGRLILMLLIGMMMFVQYRRRRREER